MARNYTALSGAAMVRKIRGQSIRRIVFCLICLAMEIAFLAALLIMMQREREYLTGIFGLLILAFVGYETVKALSKAWRICADAAHARVFRKYGSPDVLAAKISEGSTAVRLESRQTLLTDAFIMKHGDFQTYVPYENVLLLYRKEHRTNGILDSIFLVIHDTYGDKFEYPFKLGKKHAGDMSAAAQEIERHAPDCRFGYTKENLMYAEQHAKKLPEEP